MGTPMRAQQTTLGLQNGNAYEGSSLVPKLISASLVPKLIKFQKHVGHKICMHDWTKVQDQLAVPFSPESNLNNATSSQKKTALPSIASQRF